jgi:hypothetical protein
MLPIESGFSGNRHAPFEQIEKGDVVILKRSSGPVQAVWVGCFPDPFSISRSAVPPSDDCDLETPVFWLEEHSPCN